LFATKEPFAVISEKYRNLYLDIIRIIAAFAVVIGHLRGIFFVSYAEAGEGLLVKILYIDHYISRAAVMCFFVLSGYLVGTSILNSASKGKWNWRGYLIRRISRLQIVLLPALVLTACFDLVGAQMSNIYSSYLSAETISSWIGCLFFLQGPLEVVLPFGSNGPLWSLSPEFWYYILFPLIVATPFKSFTAKLLVLGALICFLGYPVISLFPCWLVGVVAGLMAKKLPINSALARQGTIWFSVFGLFATILACGAHKLGGLPADYLMSAFAALLVWACLGLPARVFKVAPAIVLFSDFSYTLYLTHAPFLMLLKASWLGNETWFPDVMHVAMMLIPLLAAVLFSYFLYLIFERNTEYVRVYLDRRLPQSVRGEKSPTS
jgi:peptidoglycan/LPS O-acetylase OafA/YrhL